MYRKIVKIDVDGVLRNMLSKMCECYNKYFDDNIQPDDVKSYDTNITFTKIKDVFGEDANEWFFTSNIGDKIYKESPIYYKAKEAIDLLKEVGYNIVIVSNQKTFTKQIETIKWLEKHNIYYDSICFTEDKKIVKGDIMIDDNIYNLQQCQTNNEELILIKAPYNKESLQFVMYDSLYDYALKINKLEKESYF